MARTQKTPAAFVSYVRFDDQHDNGRLTELCKRISSEVRVQTGDEFPIFQDRNDIQWGENWRTRIKESLSETTFLIPVITPGFFKSTACREELELFREREKQLGREDLILPIYYVSCPQVDDEKARAGDELAQLIASRQFVDWRELRFESLTSAQVGRTLATMAIQVRDALTTVRTPKRARKASKATEASIATEQAAPAVAAVESKEMESGKGATPRTTPPVHVVDLQKGPFRSIAQAIEHAKPGDRVVIRPGLYREGIVLNKPLEVIGDGDTAAIIIEASGQDALLFNTTLGRVANLTLKQVGGTGEWYGVDIGQGSLVLEDCIISSQSLSGVGIHGSADPRLRRNKISGCAQSGVFVYGKALGTLEENEISENTSIGVYIAEGANPTVRRNLIRANKQYGVCITSKSLGLIEENEIADNSLSGILVAEAARPNVRCNRVHSNVQTGILVSKSAKGVYEENDIFNNDMAGLHVMSQGNPIVRHNRIHNGKQAGIVVEDQSTGVIEWNEIYENILAGVLIRTGGNPVLRYNRIHSGMEHGIRVHKGGLGTAEGNQISGNKASGVAIEDEGNVVLRSNLIADCEWQGIWIAENGKGTVEENEISNNKRYGIVVREGASPVVMKNQVSDNAQGGVFVAAKAGGTFRGNIVFENGGKNWDVSPEATADLTEQTIA